MKDSKKDVDLYVKVLVDLAIKNVYKNDKEFSKICISQLVNVLMKYRLVRAFIIAVATKNLRSKCIKLFYNRNTSDKDNTGCTQYYMKIMRLFMCSYIENKEEVNSVGCVHAYEKRMDQFCINPNHYKPKYMQEKPEKIINHATKDLVCSHPLSFEKKYAVIEKAKKKKIGMKIHKVFKFNTNINFEKLEDDDFEHIQACRAYNKELNEVVKNSSFTNMENEMVEKLEDYNTHRLNEYLKKYQIRLEADLLEGWCMLYFYSFRQVMLDEYIPRVSCISIDGYTSVSQPGRLSIGSLLGSHKLEKVNRVAAHLGPGVCLYLKDGKVKLRNDSRYCMFIQSAFYNVCKYLQHDYIMRLEQNKTMTLYKHDLFDEIFHTFNADQQNDNYKLTQLCLSRVSFIKGWGKRYEKSILQIPIWVDILITLPCNYKYYIQPQSLNIYD